MAECPNKHCQEQREEDHDDVTALKTRWKVIGSLLSGGLVLLGIIMVVLNDYRATAQETATAAITKIEQESKENDKERGKSIQDLKIAVTEIKGNADRIEQKVDAAVDKFDKAIEDSDKKQEAILEAIEDLKK